MRDTLHDVHSKLNSQPLADQLTPLFCEILHWGRPHAHALLRRIGAPVNSTLTLHPVAQLAGLPVFRVDWPEDRTPTVTARRAVHRAIVPEHAEHMVCYLSRDGRQAAFTWARKRSDGKTELRTLPYEVGSPARTTIERLGKLAFTLDELGPTGEPPITAVTDKLNRAFDVEAVTRQFYQEIANWYFWARDQVVFPMPQGEKDHDTYIAQSLIRLITRLIFCWFVKEKGLIPNELFDLSALASLLQDSQNLRESSKTVYYKAIVQNLFFATLNQEMDKRQFRKRNKDPHGRDPHRGITNLYRYEDYFTDPKTFLHLMKNIPFLNGGLFECLDKVYRAEEGLPDVRIDGFSDHPKNPLSVPDFLFFGEERIVDLSRAYGEAKYRRAKVRGLIHTFARYNFTITEATPLDQEVALDPELAGKVFENLLAAYNPETATTARKATGSYYTPRPIVDYMVDEALIAYFQTRLHNADPEQTKKRLRHLLAYNDEPHQFKPDEVDTLIAAIDNLKALDPACGSGAFPMGLLHKLVFILGKLDPHNVRWKQQQIAKVSEIPDATVREKALADIEQAFAANELDYGRKLYLIENCIYGVDIQPIAVQIAKMRCFISLIVDQKVDDAKPNRGILSLPNLETKFVAANTLIGIERPAQQMLRNSRIDAKEAELHRIRERHFTARTPETKAKLRELDAKIRAEISDLLRADGFPREATEKLAAWDPYDQNASADFFDPEWMFGIRDGFDIVIGNPPYGFRDTLTAEQKNHFRKKEGIDFPSGDIAELFAIKTLLQFAKPNGALSYLVPKKTLYGESWQNVRKLWLENSLRFLLDASQAFENVLLEQIAFGLIKSRQQNKIAVGALDRRTQEIHVFGKFDVCDIFTRDLRNAQIYRGFYPKPLLAKIRQYGIEDASPYIRVEIGISNITSDMTFDAKGNYPCVKGVDIVRYGLKPKVRYLKGAIAKRCVDLYPQREKILAQEIIAHIENPRPHILITMFLDTEKRLFNDTCVEVKCDKRLNPKFVMGYFHSEFANWYAYNFVYNRAIRTMHFINYYATQIPLPKAALDDPSQQAPIIKLVDKILAAKRANPNADVSALEREIDRHVYRLYGLTEEEIRIVEGNRT